MYVADVLFLAIVVYLAYRFIFNFLLPIVRATHQVRQQFRDNFGDSGRQRGWGTPADGAGARPGAANGGTRDTPGGMKDPAGGTKDTPGGMANGGAGAAKRTYKPPAEDYIDFEEIK